MVLKAIIILGILCQAIAVGVSASPEHVASHLVTVVFCDVGQGDAVLISSQNSQVLIDTGPDTSVLNCLSHHMPLGDRTIELLVLTHPDKDHIGGAEAVLNRFSVFSTLLPAVGKKTQLFLQLRAALLEEKKVGMRIFVPSELSSWQIPGASAKFWHLKSQFSDARLFDQLPETELSAILADQEQGVENYNDLSIAQIIEIDKLSIVLPGDLENKGELALTESGLLNETTILKAGHHGSKSSTQVPFIAQLQPEHIVFSSGKNNNYGHPDPVVFDRISQTLDFSPQFWRTDELGAIVVRTDGVRFGVWSERKGQPTEK